MQPSTRPRRFLATALAACLAAAGAVAGARTVLVHGTMDRPAFEPLLAGFRAVHPEIGVRYEELNSIELHDGFLRAAAEGAPTADLVMSSAIDLQTKLVNDGHALTHRTPHASHLPPWAIWRDEAFAFSFEPVVIVYNRALLGPAERPASRYRLIELLTGAPERFAGRIGAYDPARSGTGYLYVTQDMEQSPVVWELIGALGQVGPRLFTASRDIIDGVVSGELLIGYNVVGSYAFARAASEPSLGVVLPEDYTLLVARTAFVSRHGRSPEQAGLLLDFLLSRAGQSIVGGPSGLFPVRDDVEARHSVAELGRRTFGGGRAVRMSPGLLVYVDPLKRDKVLRRWRDAIPAPSP